MHEVGIQRSTSCHSLSRDYTQHTIIFIPGGGNAAFCTGGFRNDEERKHQRQKIYFLTGPGHLSSPQIILIFANCFQPVLYHF